MSPLSKHKTICIQSVVANELMRVNSTLKCRNTFVKLDATRTLIFFHTLRHLCKRGGIYVVCVFFLVGPHAAKFVARMISL